MINGQKAVDYFPGDGYGVIIQPLKATGHLRDFNFSVLVSGGGKSGQIEAVRLGISRAILTLFPATKEVLKANDFLTRDPRQVERKKPGLRGARKPLSGASDKLNFLKRPKRTLFVCPRGRYYLI